MDNGANFWKKTISPEPIERIQKIQREMQARHKQVGYIHLAGRHDRIFSQIIPGTLLVAAVPMLVYSFYVLATQNAPNS